MIRIGRVAAIATMVALAGSLSAGCGSGSGVDAVLVPHCLALKVPVAVAIGARSNSPEPSLTPVVSTVVNSAIDAYKTVTLVRIDGQPKVVFSEALSSGANSELTKQAKDAYVAQLNRILAGTAQQSTDIRAQVPQADLLDALAEAASTVPTGGDVVVIDSGLQTTEPLDFGAGLLGDDPHSIVDYLRQANELPSLQGRHVYFVGLGWTASPQPALGIANRKKVVAIWEQIAKAAGASCVATDLTANTSNEVPNRPPVAIVTPPPPPGPLHPCSVINLGDNNHVGFDFNSTTFRDPVGAQTTLRRLAELIIKSNEKVTLIAMPGS